MLLGPRSCSSNCSPLELLKVCAKDTFYLHYSSNPQRGEKKVNYFHDLKSTLSTQTVNTQLASC